MIHAHVVAAKNIKIVTVKKHRLKQFKKGGIRMELAEIRNELEKTAQQIKDFRGSL